MNYLAYLLLALLLTCSVGPSGTEPVSEGAQNLFNIMKSHMATCPKEGKGARFYYCPSHLWPEIVQNFIPLVSSLGTWIKQRIGAGAAFWYLLAKHLGNQIVKYDPQEFGKIRDEAVAWCGHGNGRRLPRAHGRRLPHRWHCGRTKLFVYLLSLTLLWDTGGCHGDGLLPGSDTHH